MENVSQPRAAAVTVERRGRTFLLFYRKTLKNIMLLKDLGLLLFQILYFAKIVGFVL